MIDLRKALTDYLAVRRSLGFKLQWAQERLSAFLDHLEQAGSPVITIALAVEWATLPEGATATWWAQRLTYVRGFARYLHSLDPRHEVPPIDLMPVAIRRKPVYLYSEEDVQTLLGAARELKGPFRAHTYSTLIALLAVTGMRVGEAIALDRSDVDRKDAVLTIRNAKFGKSREVPLHATTMKALATYARERDRTFPGARIPAFFVSQRNTRLIYQNVHLTFFRLIDRVGFGEKKPHRPRIHDLRHSFALWTLRDWYRAGDDVERRLPRLSTYLGHGDPSSTYWYLQAAPELMELAAKRLEHRLGELP
jgi:integrase